MYLIFIVHEDDLESLEDILDNSSYKIGKKRSS